MRLIKIGEVKHITGLHVSTINQYMSEGHFPTPVSFGGSSSSWLWLSTEIQIWIAEIFSERDFEVNEHLLNGEQGDELIPMYKKVKWEYIPGRCLPPKHY